MYDVNVASAWNSSNQNISCKHIILMVNYYMYMALITTDRVPIWLLGNLQYSVTEN